MRYRIIATVKDAEIKFKVQYYIGGWWDEDNQEPFDTWQEARDHVDELMTKGWSVFGTGRIKHKRRGK